MNADIAEAVCEARLHEGARLGIERPPWRTQHLIDSVGNVRHVAETAGLALQLAVLLAFLALTGAGALPLQGARGRGRAGLRRGHGRNGSPRTSRRGVIT